MNQIDLDPERFHRVGRPRIISRKMAAGLLVWLLICSAFGQWLLAHSADWWDDFLTWPGLIFCGALITRLWPLLFLKDED